MPKETEIDRILRQRREQQEASTRRAKVEADRQAIARHQSMVDEIRTEIPLVLQLLKELGYPDVEEITFYEKVPWYQTGGRPHIDLGMAREVTKAAWKIADHPMQYGNGSEISYATGAYYLLADGRIVGFAGGHGGYVTSLQELKSGGKYTVYDFQSSAEIHEGIRALRHKFEAMKHK